MRAILCYRCVLLLSTAALCLQVLPRMPRRKHASIAFAKECLIVTHSLLRLRARPLPPMSKVSPAAEDTARGAEQLVREPDPDIAVSSVGINGREASAALAGESSDGLSVTMTDEEVAARRLQV